MSETHVLVQNVFHSCLFVRDGLDEPQYVPPGGLLAVPVEYADAYVSNTLLWRRPGLVTKPARGRGRRPVSRTSSVGKRPAKSKAAVSTAAASEVNREGLSA